MLNKILLSTLLLAFSFGVQASETQQNLKAHTFEDQWDKSQALNEQTSWVIFSSHKAGGEWVKKALVALDVNDLAAQNWLYVADISAMPGLISKFIAIPKMQDYPFAIALEKEGEFTQNWPKQEEAVSVYKLNQLQIEKVEYFKSEEALTEFLKTIKQ